MRLSVRLCVANVPSTSEYHDINTSDAAYGTVCPDQPESITTSQGRGPLRTRLWLTLILLLGFALRAAALHWGQAFCYGSQGDCLEAYQVAVNFARGEPRAQYLGQPNYNEHAKLPGPLWSLFCSTGLRAFGSIHGALWAIVLLNTAAIFLTYLLAARTVGNPAALWAALLMATSPAIIEFSVVLFNPVVMAFFGAALFLALWQVTQHQRSRAAFWLFFLPLMSLQFHMSGLMLIAAVLGILCLKPTRLNLPWLLAGLLAALVLYLPYVRGEFAHNWQNTRGMFAASRHGHSFEVLKVFIAPPSFLVNIWDARWTFQPGEFKTLARATVGSYPAMLGFNALSVVTAIALVLGMFSPVRDALRGFWKSPRATFARSPGPVFLLVTLSLPLLVSLLEGKRFHGRYSLVVLPSFFALAGLAAVHLFSYRRVRRAFLPVLLLTLAANVLLVLTIYRYQGRSIEQGDLFLPSFDKLETVYQALKTHAGNDRPILVDDPVYAREFASGNPAVGYRHQICDYIALRERERFGLIPPSVAPITYKLLPADAVPLAYPGVAYRKHGLVLVAPGNTPANSAN